MKILFVSNDLIGGNIARVLVNEGHDVKLYIHEKARRQNLDYIVSQTKDWKKELTWVGKDGLIVFDDIGWGKIQDNLRKKGYTVFGGSLGGDKLEEDREFAQEIFTQHGIKTKETKNFDNIVEAIEFIQKNPRAWVVKQNGHASKGINYVGHFDDGRDVISLLKNYMINPKMKREHITLQEKIVGVEIGVGRYFNGNDWVGPIEYNIEHKKFFPGDIGPTTSEMGTIAWYDDKEDNKLYKDILAPIKPYLQKINFRGDFEINCIVNEDGAFPLEATPRFGSPIIHLHTELHISSWGELLFKISKGETFDFKWKKGFGIVILLAVPPFPYAKKALENHFGVSVFFDNITKEEFSHIHFEEISEHTNKKDSFYISDERGYVLYVTEVKDTIEKARDEAYKIVNKIIIPKMIYRNDIGKRFVERDMQRLKDWGYL